MKVWQETGDERVRLVFKGDCPRTSLDGLGALCDTPGNPPVYVRPDSLAESGTPCCPECGEDLEYLRTEIQEERATPEEREEAANLYSNMDGQVEVDTDARASYADDAVWVSAWVRVPRKEEES
jgi:hypothetical protein